MASSNGSPDAAANASARLSARSGSPQGSVATSASLAGTLDAGSGPVSIASRASSADSCRWPADAASRAARTSRPARRTGSSAGVRSAASRHSVAAAAGAPRPPATVAASSSAAARSPSESRVARARCRAFSTGSSTAAASRACASRRAAEVASAYTNSRSSGWLNRNRPADTSTRPSFSASANSGSIDRPAAAVSRSTVGRGDDAAYSSTPRVGAASSPSRSPSSVFSRLDTGSGSSGDSSPGCRSTARPSSSAMNGLPALAVKIRCAVRTGSGSSSWPRSSAVTSGSASGGTSTCSSGAGQASAIVGWSSACSVAIICTPSVSRRAQNRSTSRLDGSAHWMSSTASSTGPFWASRRSTCSTASRTASSSRSESGALAFSNATSSGWRRCSGSTFQACSSWSLSRSSRVTYGSPASLADGAALSTWVTAGPRAACSTSATADLPIPVGPKSSTLPPASSCPRACSIRPARPTRSASVISHILPKDYLR